MASLEARAVDLAKEYHITKPLFLSGPDEWPEEDTPHRSKVI